MIRETLVKHSVSRYDTIISRLPFVMLNLLKNFAKLLKFCPNWDGFNDLLGFFSKLGPAFP